MAYLPSRALQKERVAFVSTHFDRLAPYWAHG
jgi:hypothetical protein